MNMKYNCDLISDLLPLYKDDICSEATKKIVEEHLAECKDCKKMFADMSDVSIFLPSARTARRCSLI